MGVRGRALTVLVGCLAVLAAAGLWLGLDFRSAQAEQVRIARVVLPAADAARDLGYWQAEAAVRLDRAVVSMDADDAGEVSRALAEARGMLERIGVAVPGSAAIESAADRAGSAFRAWVQSDVEPALAAVRDGDEPRAQRVVDAGAERYAQMVSATGALLAAIDADREVAAGLLGELTDRLGLALLMTAVALAVTWVAVFWFLHRWILLPVRRLRADVRLAAQPGDHHLPIPVRGPAEIADLSRDAESMRRQIVHELDEARAAREALQQDGPLAAAWDATMHRAGRADRPGVRVAGTSQAAEGVITGDWWDVVDGPDRTVAVVIGDVAGHGVAAATTAISARAAIRAGLAVGAAPGAALTAASRALGGWHCLTAIVAVIDPAARTLRYASAGHPPGVLVDAQGGLALLPPTGMVLCPLAGPIADRTLAIAPGALLLLGTDGLFEARMADGSELGEAGLLASVRGLGSRDRLDPQGAIDAVLAAARGRVAQWASDDVTVLAALLEQGDGFGDPTARMS